MIRVSNLGKRYELGLRQRGYTTLRESVLETLRDPLNMLRGRNGESEILWALDDISFEVQQGEVLGIIGRNGAGKSTLLKILSRITEPTKGRVELYGRVGSLLEVGTGFHPELSGRENIFLSGAILGMKAEEIKRKFEEIVSFAEIEKFIDTPVKRYSSGMYMRLAFAVAAHLEPEILLVDEVLAVGDAAFQKKCLGKMSDVAKQGRTVLFVSHNMTAVSQLCLRSILFVDGRIHLDGKSSEVVPRYLQGGGAAAEYVWTEIQRAPGNENVKLHAVRIKSTGTIKNDVDIDKDVSIEVEFWNLRPGVRNLCTTLYLLDGLGTVVLSTGNTPAANSRSEEWFGKPHPAGLFRTTCTFPGNFFNEGAYSINVYIATLGPLSVEVDAPQVLSFTVFDSGVMREPGGGTGWPGVIRVRLPWQTEYLGEDSEAK
jgi:lipopolysaccharide transport system ATP-binding protein